MNYKTGKRILGWLCASALLCGAIPTNGIVALATDAATETSTGVEFYDASGAKIEEAEYSLHGVEYVYDDITEQGLFVRLPEEDAVEISKEKTFTGTTEPSLFNGDGDWFNTVYSLARESAGGRIRFNTNSTTIKIEAQLYLHDFAHYDHGDSMKAAQLGLDVYVDTAEGSTYAGTVQGTPELVYDVEDADGDGKTDEIVDIASSIVDVQGEITFDTAESRDITVYLPIVIETNSVKISVDDGSTVSQHVKGYEGEGQIVFYGSSITQGGAVTKPGNTYVNTVGRNLNREYIDFGMWGRCKGETAFANYIASLGNVSAFVLDYDHNNSNTAGLSNHYAFYEKIRDAYPDIPIIMMTRPGSGIDNSKAQYPDDGYSSAAEMKAVIRQSYETAKAAGDENVHFIDGETFFGYSKAYMADNSHPNDAGQAKMAEVVTAAFKQIYAGQKNLCIEPSTCDEELVMSEDFSGVEAGTAAPEGWQTSMSTITTGTMGVDENGTYEFDFLRDGGGSQMTLFPNATYWSDGSNSAVEMDVNLYKTVYENTTVFPQLGIKIGETPCSATMQKYEIRIRPFYNRYTVYLYDGTNGTNPSSALKTTNLYDQSFVDMYNNSDAISFNLRIETEHVADGSVNISVLVNGTQVFGTNLIPQETGFEPNHFRIFCYGTVSGANHKATVDNIKAYSLPEHTLEYVEVPDTTTDTGIKSFYECSKCDKKFLDDKGIVPATDNGYVFTKGCEKELFSDDFENGESKWSKYTTNYTGNETYGIVTEESGNHVYQMLVERASSNVSNYINTDAILNGQSSYTIEMQGTLHQGSDAWPTISMRLRNHSSPGYEIQYQPTAEGHFVTLRDRTGSGAVYKLPEVADEKLLEQMATGQVSYKLRVEVERFVIDETTHQVKFTVYNEELKLCEETITLLDPTIEVTRLFVYLYTGEVKNSTVYKATVDNVKVFYTDYYTITPVVATPSTDTVAGLKAHYGCDVCGKKYADANGTEEVTVEQLAYAKLTDIKCQLGENEDDATKTDIRFVAYLEDYKQYQSVTFTITCVDGTGTAICKDVYSAIYADGVLLETEDVYGTDGYFATFILKNNTEDDLAKETTVTVTWTALDGTTTTATRTISSFN